MISPPPSRNSKKPKLPVQQLAILALCRLAEPIALTGVNPYLPEMMESFNVPKDKISTWAGTTAAAFSLSQCLTSFLWRRLSDAYGRKAAVLLSLACAMLSTLLFGVSTGLAWAVLARCLSGAGNGMVGIVRTMVAELVPQKSLQPRAFSVMPLVWCLGNALGPIIGGALASPARKFPTVFSNAGFFGRFPFALPNFAAGGLFLMGIVVGVLFLEETLESKAHERDTGLVVGKYVIRIFSFSRKGKVKSWAKGDEMASPLLKDTDGVISHTEKAEVRVGWQEILTFQTNMNLFVSAVLSWHSIAFDQLVAVFLHLPEQDHSAANPDVQLPWKFSGGFGFDSGKIGLLFTFYGIFAMTTQLFLYPHLARRYGILPIFRLSTLAYLPAYTLLPFTVLLPTPTLRLASLLACMGLKCLADVVAYPCSTIMLTNSANSIPVLGAVNAMAVSTASLAKAAGPYFAGSLFSWGVRRGVGVVAWWGLAGVAVVGQLGTWGLREMEGPSAGRKGHEEMEGEGSGGEENWGEEGIELVDNTRGGSSSRGSSLDHDHPRGRLLTSVHNYDDIDGTAMMRKRSEAELDFPSAIGGPETGDIVSGAGRRRSPLFR